MNEVVSKIEGCRKKLDAWLDAIYAKMPEQRYVSETDCCYPEWGEIEDLIELIFDDRLVQRLPSKSVDSILFFISRSDECGRIIGWLGHMVGAPLSNIGDLSEDDFLFLCRESLRRPEDFCDYHLAASFLKFAHGKAEFIEILLSFFKRTESYTRRRALGSLAHLKYHDLPAIVTELWDTDECEFAKLSCLYALKEFSAYRSQFECYLAEFETRYDVKNKDHLTHHLNQLKS